MRKPELDAQLGKGATSEAGSISSELLMCGGSVHIILLLPPVPRCLETTDVYIYGLFAIYLHVCIYVCCSDCDGVCVNVCCVARIVKDSV